MRVTIPAIIRKMPLTVKRPKEKSDESIIADATDRLLLATKKKMLKEEGRIDYDKLVRGGFSGEMIARLKAL